MSTGTDRIAEKVLRTNARLPLVILHGIGNVLGSLLYLLPGKRTATCRKNIQACFPELSVFRQQLMIWRNLRHTAKALMEVGRLWLLPTESTLGMIKAVYGEEYITDCLDKGKGVILAAPHLGAWEVAGIYVSSKYPITTMYQEPPLKGLSHIIKDGRESSGGNYVPADGSGIRAMLKALRKGEMIALLPDQVPSQGGVIAPFFKHPALTISLLSTLAEKTDATVIFGFARRLSWSRGYTMHFIKPDQNISSTPVDESTRRVNAQVEECIRMIPNQYLWVYKRFQKNGEAFYQR